LDLDFLAHRPRPDPSVQRKGVDQTPGQCPHRMVAFLAFTPVIPARGATGGSEFERDIRAKKEEARSANSENPSQNARSSPFRLMTPGITANRRNSVRTKMVPSQNAEGYHRRRAVNPSPFAFAVREVSSPGDEATVAMAFDERSGHT
jgi:hypothetical protein